MERILIFKQKIFKEKFHKRTTASGLNPKQTAIEFFKRVEARNEKKSKLSNSK